MIQKWKQPPGSPEDGRMVGPQLQARSLTPHSCCHPPAPSSPGLPQTPTVMAGQRDGGPQTRAADRQGQGRLSGLGTGARP